MTKDELLTDLESKFYKLGDISEAETNPAGKEIRKREGIKWYLAGVYEVNGSVMLRRNVSFYVANEGTPEEEAFIAEKPLQEKTIPSTMDTPFRTLVSGEITKKIIAGTLLKGIIQACNETERFADVLAYIDVDGMVEKKGFFAYEDTSGTLQIKEMG